MSNNCTELSVECPAELSVYGYLPNVPANAFFLGFFGLFGLLNLGLGIKYRTWSYMVALCLACLTEAIGYVGRIIMHSNPFADSGFITQICCLIIAPAFNSAAIYLTLKHIALCFGPEYSFIKPRFYTYIFICADFISLLLQAIGGALASTADTQDEQDLGDNLMMAGISWQVAALAFFAATAAVYVVRVKRGTRHTPLSLEAAATLKDIKFRLFALGVVVAWFTIFIRCVYRIIEMAGGWRNDIMQNEAGFIVLEGVMIVIATACQTIFHPGFCFPRLSSKWNQEYNQVETTKTSQEVSMEELRPSNAAYTGARYDGSANA